jgi:hypothetical protein
VVVRNSSLGKILAAPLLVTALALATCIWPASADTVPGGVRFLGNTWNEALMVVPSNPSHAEFVKQGNLIEGVRIHMLETDAVWVDIDGKKYELHAEPGAFCAEWLNEFLADTVRRVNAQHPYLTQTVAFSIARDGQPFNYNHDATIAKAGPFLPLPQNMKSINLRIYTSPGQPTISEATSVELAH